MELYLTCSLMTLDRYLQKTNPSYTNANSKVFTFNFHVNGTICKGLHRQKARAPLLEQ